MDGLIKIIQDFIGNDKLATTLMSIIPLIELKGGIIFARGAGMDFFLSFIFAYVGSTLAFVFVYWLLKPVLALLKKIKFVKGFAQKAESYISLKAQNTLKERAENGKKTHSEKFYKALAIFIFVAIPLPMTGVWMGTAIAVFLDMRFSETILPVALGNFVAGLIISLLAELCIRVWDITFLNYVLYGLLGLALILLVVTISKILKGKKQE